MNKHRTWTLIGIALASIWLAVAVVMWATDDQVSHPEKVLGLMETAPWLENPNLNASLRGAYIDKVVKSQTRLDFDQRRRLREDGDATLKAFLESMSEPEQHRYVDGTVEPFLQKVLKIIDSMTPETRKSIAARLRRETGGRQAGPGKEGSREGASLEGERRGGSEESEFDDMLSFGLEMQYRDAVPAKKLEMAQMLENLQAFLQGFRR
jgi:hypothetical protein